MSEEVRLDLPLGPVVDGEGDGVKADWSVPQEEAAEVYPVDFVEHGVEAGDLTDVIADDVQQAPRNVGLTELPLLSVGAVQLKCSTIEPEPARLLIYLDNVAKT